MGKSLYIIILSSCYFMKVDAKSPVLYGRFMTLLTCFEHGIGPEPSTSLRTVPYTPIYAITFFLRHTFSIDIIIGRVTAVAF